MIHVGVFDGYAREYMADLVEKLQSKFPHGQSTYWDVNITCPPYGYDDDTLVQQAKILLRELRNLRRHVKNERPIVFFCWGMPGGILLKQV
jgi:hypothetical protein